MNKERFYISTIAEDGAEVARQYGLGLEIAEYCTAYNLDEQFEQTDAVVSQKLQGVEKKVFHAPFNELFPCGIDPKARELAQLRYRQAIDCAQRYGAEKIIVHGGYYPLMFVPCWYTEQSILFWRAFLQETPADVQLCLENVLEEEPGMLLDILKGVNDPRLRMCLDVGHVHVYAKGTPLAWLDACAPYISHFHIHNNSGERDTHRGLTDGSIPMKELLCRAEKLCKDATFTLELTQAAPSVRWLQEENII